MLEQSFTQHVSRYSWVGSREAHLDVPETTSCRQVVIGSYGGHTEAGAHKNEDGALVWCAGDGSWEFSMILDGHNTAQSVELVEQTIQREMDTISMLLAQPVETALRALQQHLLAVFQSVNFRASCRMVMGETACLICARKGQFLWWFCIGDCVVYLFHPELARLKQYALNQRSFFEWVGGANTFDLPVPCYSSGIRELSAGTNRIVMITHGLLEFGSRPFEDPQCLYRLFMPTEANTTDLPTLVHTALMQVHREQGRTSATVIAWDATNPHGSAKPTLEPRT